MPSLELTALCVKRLRDEDWMVLSGAGRGGIKIYRLMIYYYTNADQNLFLLIMLPTREQQTKEKNGRISSLRCSHGYEVLATSIS